MSSPFFRSSEGIERVKDILNIIQTTTDSFSSDPEKQQMYITGLGLWAQDLQEAIGELGNGSTTTDTTTTK